MKASIDLEDPFAIPHHHLKNFQRCERMGERCGMNAIVELDLFIVFFRSLGRIST